MFQHQLPEISLGELLGQSNLMEYDPFVTTRFESPLKIVILFSLFSEDIIPFLPKNTFNSIGEEHIIHFISLPVVFLVLFQSEGSL